MHYWSTLSYFEIFNHPLTAAEVMAFSPDATTMEQVQSWLDEQVEAGHLFCHTGYYQTTPDPEKVHLRLEQEAIANTFIPKAMQMGRLIGTFPFVRGVMISGSLSKHRMQADSDVDFFIITTPGRLWLSRTLLMLYKKIWLLNNRKYFCINYFIDTEHLEIEEKNLFTATEIATLLPVVSPELYQQFMAANAWVRADFLPNFPLRDTLLVQERTGRSVQGFLEWLLAGRLGKWLDTSTMGITVRYWRRKFDHFDSDTFDQAMKSRSYISKHHPLWFQEKVLKAHEAKLAERAI